MFYIYSIILTIWNYLTPVFYSIEILPKPLQGLFQLNPLYMFINGARDIVLYGHAPSLINIVTMGGVAVLTMLIGLFVFTKNQDKFIYYI